MEEAPEGRGPTGAWADGVKGYENHGYLFDTVVPWCSIIPGNDKNAISAAPGTFLMSRDQPTKNIASSHK